MEAYSQQELISLVKEFAIEFGDFTLASGAKSAYYLDCRRLTLHSRGAKVIAAGILETLQGDMPDAVGGMAIGADPITGAVITQAGIDGIDLKGFIVRKEAKQHGKGRQVEGPVQPGDRAVIVEDVITTGGSAIKAIEHCTDFGLEIVGVIGIVDRLAGGEEAFAAKGYQLKSLLMIRDLGIDS